MEILLSFFDWEEVPIRPSGDRFTFIFTDLGTSPLNATPFVLTAFARSSALVGYITWSHWIGQIAHRPFFGMIL